jgi:hypothetical protein
VSSARRDQRTECGAEVVCSLLPRATRNKCAPRRRLLYTPLESAKLAGMRPWRYLAAATRRAIATPARVTLPRDLLDA